MKKGGRKHHSIASKINPEAVFIQQNLTKHPPPGRHWDIEGLALPSGNLQSNEALTPST